MTMKFVPPNVPKPLLIVAVPGPAVRRMHCRRSVPDGVLQKEAVVVVVRDAADAEALHLRDGDGARHIDGRGGMRGDGDDGGEESNEFSHGGKDAGGADFLSLRDNDSSKTVSKRSWSAIARSSAATSRNRFRRTSAFRPPMSSRKRCCASGARCAMRGMWTIS